MLQHQLSEASLLPVRNQINAVAMPYGRAPQNANVPPTSLDIPLLGLPLRALIDRQSFSFSLLSRASPADLPVSLKNELSRWVERIFVQFRHLELVLGCA